MRVYLSGTITADPATHFWRKQAAQWLLEADPFAEVLDPLRGKDLGSLSHDGMKCNNDPGLLFARDKQDVTSADVVILNTIGMAFLGRQSIGTWIEAGWADMLGTPIIVVAAPGDPLEAHPFLKAVATIIVPSVEEAVNAALWLR